MPVHLAGLQAFKHSHTRDLSSAALESSPTGKHALDRYTYCPRLRQTHPRAWRRPTKLCVAVDKLEQAQKAPTSMNHSLSARSYCESWPMEERP